MNSYLNVLVAEADSARRGQQLQRELEWARRRSDEAVGGAAAPRGHRRPLRRWLHALAGARG
jgi:hypothetical protein